MSNSHLRRLVLALAIGCSSLGLTAAETSASGTACNQSGFNPSTCIHLHGSGLHVDYMQVGVQLNSRQSTRGHWQIWAPSPAPVNTTEQLWVNSSWLGAIVWGPRWNYNRNFADNQRVCAKYWRNNGNGTWSDRGQACVTVHR
jgi:hypothetical protein